MSMIAHATMLRTSVLSHAAENTHANTFNTHKPIIHIRKNAIQNLTMSHIIHTIVVGIISGRIVYKYNHNITISYQKSTQTIQ